MRALNTQFVESYFSHMLSHFGAELINRDDFLSQHLDDIIPGYDQISTVADALGLLGADDPLSFIKGASITIGGYICVPYDPGVFTSEFSLDYQCANIAHEIKHILQWQEDRALFPVNYLTSRSKRTNYEIQAMKPELEISFHRHGRLPSIRQMANSLHENYFVREADARVARLHLEAYATPVKDGSINSVVGKEAIRFMKGNGF